MSYTDLYREHGFVHVPDVFSAEETAELADELDWMTREWAMRFPLPGPWRRAYMDAADESQSQLEVLQNLHWYSAAWERAVRHPNIVAVMRELIGSDDVEFHFSTMHTKPPETGDPFPMHQDYPFFPHTDERYVEVLFHLDDTCHENGEIRFLDGSHRGGPIDHVMEGFFHLDTDNYKLADSVPVPAKAGDVVCFNLCTVHGSYPNTTDRARRMVRVTYRHPENAPVGESPFPGFLVSGRRTRRDGQDPLPHRPA